MRAFSKESDYLIHFHTSEICMKIRMEPASVQPKHEIPTALHIMIVEWLSRAITDGTNRLRCRHCQTTFTNLGNLNKHLYTALACNRMAYIEFKKIVGDF